jgi:diguanylate cyclase (GGDEF)-like protein
MLELFERRSALFWIIIGSIFVVGVGISDILTGNEFAFSLFYLIPIFLVTWFSGKQQGIVISIISAVMWFIADILAGKTYTHPVIRYWNAVARLCSFLVVALLIPALKALEYEKGLARMDHLTGAANRRHFFEVLQTELDRSRRYKNPFTIAYIDLDGFKLVNDKWGHRAGDRLLCAVVKRAKRELRKTDIIARMGGDEFVIFFPEMGQDAARIAVPKMNAALVAETGRHKWPVTFSIGILTYRDGPINADELVKTADELMYSVKRCGKNGMAYAVCDG